MLLPVGTKLTLLAPMIRGRKGEYKKELNQLRKEGFTRVVLDGTLRASHSSAAYSRRYVA